MASLTITSGEMEGQKVKVDQDEISIGRSDQNTLALDDPAISGSHCAVIRDGNKYSIKDHNSTNGTRLNGKNVTEARLKPGDIITVGAIDIAIDGEDIEVEPEPGPITRGNTTPTTILSPPRNISSNNAGGNQPPPAFHAKRDNKVLFVGLIVLCIILVVAAMAWFMLQLNK